MQMSSKITLKQILLWIITSLIVMIISGFVLAAVSRWYDVWSMEMQGKAKLAEASQSRQIQVEQAKAEKESATLRADAIAIVGQAAKDFPEYRQQEYIGAFAEALKEGKMSQIIYIPTEAGMPILEAGRKVSHE
jgi:hypothetical protein